MSAELLYSMLASAVTIINYTQLYPSEFRVVLRFLAHIYFELIPQSPRLAGAWVTIGGEYGQRSRYLSQLVEKRSFPVPTNER